jgi:hypothetical protein
VFDHPPGKDSLQETAHGRYAGRATRTHDLGNPIRSQASGCEDLLDGTSDLDQQGLQDRLELFPL